MFSVFLRLDSYLHYRDNGKDNGNYHHGVGYCLYSRIQGLGFPKMMGTFWGVPTIMITVYWVLYWGPPYLGNYRISTAAGHQHLLHKRPTQTNKHGSKHGRETGVTHLFSRMIVSEAVPQTPPTPLNIAEWRSPASS